MWINLYLKKAYQHKMFLHSGTHQQQGSESWKFPTDDMPLQGVKFNDFQAHIMSIPEKVSVPKPLVQWYKISARLEEA